jgi:hypothetical protein
MSDLLSTASLALEGNTSMSKDRTKRLIALVASEGNTSMSLDRMKRLTVLLAVPARLPTRDLVWGQAPARLASQARTPRHPLCQHVLIAVLEGT